MQVPQMFPAAGDARGLNRTSEQVATLLLAALTLIYAIWSALDDLPEQAAIGGALGLALCLVARQIRALNAQAGRFAQHVQREDEARSTALVRHLHDVIAILDADGAIQYVSPSIEGRLGRPAAALRGTSAFALVMPSDAPAARALLADAVANPHETIVTDLHLL